MLEEYYQRISHTHKVNLKSQDDCIDRLFFVRSDGQAVGGSYCRRLEPPGEVRVSCTVECPVDCVVSAWSPWDEAGCRCGLYLANITRTRLEHNFYIQVQMNPVVTVSIFVLLFPYKV